MEQNLEINICLDFFAVYSWRVKSVDGCFKRIYLNKEGNKKAFTFLLRSQIKTKFYDTQNRACKFPRGWNVNIILKQNFAGKKKIKRRQVFK